ncbi:MAG: prolipoprotein diacylglyceryl transferase family protein [Spirochaetota bacterium]
MIERIPINLFGWEGPSTFSIMLMLAFLTGSYLLPRELKRRGLVPEAADSIVFLGVIGTLIGAKVFFIFEIWDQIFVKTPGYSQYIYPLTHWNGIPGHLGVWSSLFSGGGLVFYGGFLFGVAFILLYFRTKKYKAGEYFDAMAPTMAIGYCLGRLGCFISGDGCYGHYTDADIPILVHTFQGAHPSGVPVWNTPVMEAFTSFLFFLYFQFYARYQNFKTYSIFWQYIFLHGLARLSFEFLRVNKAVIPFWNPPQMANIPHPAQNPEFLKNYYWHGFSQSQYISLLFVLLSLFFLLRYRMWVTTTREM